MAEETTTQQTAEETPLTQDEIQSVLTPEITHQAEYKLGDQTVRIRPLTRRWQGIFFASAWPMIEAQLHTPESILKSVLDKTFLFNSTVETIIKDELIIEQHIDRAAAVVIASQIPGSRNHVEESIAEGVNIVLDSADTDTLRKIVNAQIAKERLAERVGEALPARFLSLLNLAGVKGMTMATALPHLISSLAKLQAAIGDGN